MKFNVWGQSIHGNAYHRYFTSAIPRMLMAPALLFVFFIPYDLLKRINKVTKDQKYLKEESDTGPKPFLPLMDFLLPTVAFVALYSVLPHKELRFILPSVAGFNICTAYALSRLWELRMKFGSSSKNPWMKRLAEVLFLFWLNAFHSSSDFFVAAFCFSSDHERDGHSSPRICVIQQLSRWGRPLETAWARVVCCYPQSQPIRSGACPHWCCCRSASM